MDSHDAYTATAALRDAQEARNTITALSAYDSTSPRYPRGVAAMIGALVFLTSFAVVTTGWWSLALLIFTVAPLVIGLPVLVLLQERKTGISPRMLTLGGWRVWFGPLATIFLVSLAYGYAAGAHQATGERPWLVVASGGLAGVGIFAALAWGDSNLRQYARTLRHGKDEQ